MNNKPIPILNFKVEQLIRIERNERATLAKFWHNPDFTMPELGSIAYLTLEEEYLGCYVLSQINSHSITEIELWYTDIASSLLENQIPISVLTKNTSPYPFQISGNNEGSIRYWNQNSEGLLCFPLIGYQKWPTNKPTNLKLIYLPPAIRINSLLKLLANELGIEIAPISENLLLPYFQNSPIQWPWNNLGSISLVANNAGLTVESELGILSEAHTSLKRKYETTFLDKYEVVATLNLQLENTGTTANTGLAFINITDPSQVLLKHQTIISYSVASNSNANYVLNLTGSGIENDILSIHLEPDSSLANLNFSFEGTIVPTTETGLSLPNLLANYSLADLLKLIETNTGKTWQWNNYQNQLELVTEQTSKFNLPDALEIKAIIATPNLNIPAKPNTNSIVKTISQYLHLNSVTTLSLALPTSKNLLPDYAETIVYAQAKFLVSEPENENLDVLIEGYPTLSFVPNIIAPINKLESESLSLKITYQSHVHKVSELFSGQKITWETIPYLITGFTITLVKNNLLQYGITAKKIAT